MEEKSNLINKVQIEFDEIKENLNDVQKARWLYIRLGELLIYDEDYYIFDEKEKKKLYNKDINEIDKEAICSTITKIYTKLLNDNGIKAESVEYKTKYLGHMFTEFECNNKKYSADLTHDLIVNIKMGLKTKHFMQIPEGDIKKFMYSEISDNELKEIDEKVGYIKNGMYMDDVIKMLQKEMLLLNDKNSQEGKKLREELGIDELNQRQILEYKIEFIRKHFNLLNLIPTAKSDLFQNLMKNFVDSSDIKRFDYNSFKCVDNENKIRVFSVIKDKELQDKMTYMFSDKDFAERVDINDVKEMVNKGMRTLSSKNESKKLLEELINITEDNVKLSDINEQGNILEEQSRNVEGKNLE